MRNFLAVLRSIIRRTAGSRATVDDYVAHLEDRLNAYARIIAELAYDGTVDLAGMIAEELLSHAAHEDDQINIDGPPVRLSGKTAEVMGLAIHELAINAMEHGVLGTATGRIAATWTTTTLHGDPAIEFVWRETGFATRPILERIGFGLTYTERTLPYELGAVVSHDIGNDELVWRIRLPLMTNPPPHAADVPRVDDVMRKGRARDG